MNMEEYKKYVNSTCKKIENKLDVNSEEFYFFINLVQTFNQVCIERNNLEQALNEIEKYIKQQQDEQSEQAGFYNAFIEFITINTDYLLEIINKAKGNE